MCEVYASFHQRLEQEAHARTCIRSANRATSPSLAGIPSMDSPKSTIEISKSTEVNAAHVKKA